MKQLLTAAPILPLAFFFVACGGGTQTQTKPVTALPDAHVDSTMAGSISGRVLFHGEAPVMPTIDMSSNPNCERQHTTPVKAQTVVVNSNGTLRYAFVWIKSGLAAAHWAPPTEPAVLRQSGCVYEPHVIGIMENQPMEIVNDDPINHNVHAESQSNPPWNESQAPKAEHKFKRFATEEVLFPVTCSIHPWMRAYVGVSPHPFFAVTGEDGSFALKGVPPGTYTIEVVQEKLGRKEGTLTLPASGNATIDFTYGS